MGDGVRKTEKLISILGRKAWQLGNWRRVVGGGEGGKGHEQRSSQSVKWGKRTPAEHEFWNMTPCSLTKTCPLLEAEHCHPRFQFRIIFFDHDLKMTSIKLNVIGWNRSHPHYMRTSADILYCDIVWTVYHLVIYMQSNKIHKVFQWVSLFSTYVSSTCFGPHRSIFRGVLYKLYSQIWYVVIRVLLDMSSGCTCRVD